MMSYNIYCPVQNTSILIKFWPIKFLFNYKINKILDVFDSQKFTTFRFNKHSLKEHSATITSLHYSHV